MNTIIVRVYELTGLLEMLTEKNVLTSFYVHTKNGNVVKIIRPFFYSPTKHKIFISHQIILAENKSDWLYFISQYTLIWGPSWMLTAAHKNVIIGSRANTLQIPFFIFRTHQNLLMKCSGSLLVLKLQFWVWQLLAASEGLSSSRNCPTVLENPMIWIIYFQGDFFVHFHHVTHDGYY